MIYCTFMQLKKQISQYSKEALRSNNIETLEVRKRETDLLIDTLNVLMNRLDLKWKEQELKEEFE